MSTSTAPPTPYVYWLVESRPPSLTWLRPSPPPSNQPPLDLNDHQRDSAEISHSGQGVRLSTVKARWSARPRPGLPDAQQWSTTLALAIIQAMLGQRPVAQLNRWMVDDVLAAISLMRRHNLKVRGGRSAVPAALRSIRVQHPSPEVAEVSAHVVIGKRSAAMAFRLEALGDRWLCTALELAARNGLRGVSS